MIEADAVGRTVSLLAFRLLPMRSAAVRRARHRHAACLGSLTACLEPYGITENLVQDPMNVFMRQAVHPDSATGRPALRPQQQYPSASRCSRT